MGVLRKQVERRLTEVFGVLYPRTPKKAKTDKATVCHISLCLWRLRHNKPTAREALSRDEEALNTPINTHHHAPTDEASLESHPTQEWPFALLSTSQGAMQSSIASSA